VYQHEKVVRLYEHLSLTEHYHLRINPDHTVGKMLQIAKTFPFQGQRRHWDMIEIIERETYHVMHQMIFEIGCRFQGKRQMVDPAIRTTAERGDCLIDIPDNGTWRNVSKAVNALDQRRIIDITEGLLIKHADCIQRDCIAKRCCNAFDEVKRLYNYQPSLRDIFVPAGWPGPGTETPVFIRPICDQPWACV
jgi:nitroreductase